MRTMETRLIAVSNSILVKKNRNSAKENVSSVSLPRRAIFKSRACPPPVNQGYAKSRETANQGGKQGIRLCPKTPVRSNHRVPKQLTFSYISVNLRMMQLCNFQRKLGTI